MRPKKSLNVLSTIVDGKAGSSSNLLKRFQIRLQFKKILRKFVNLRKKLKLSFFSLSDYLREHFLLEIPLKSWLIALQSYKSHLILTIGSSYDLLAKNTFFHYSLKQPKNFVLSYLMASLLRNDKSPQGFPLYGPLDRFQDEVGAI